MVVLSPISNPLLVPAQYPPDPNPPGPIRGPFRVCGQLRQLDPSGCAAQILRRQQFQTLKIKAISSNRYKSLFFREDYQPWVFFGGPKAIGNIVASIYEKLCCLERHTASCWRNSFASLSDFCSF